MFFLSVKTFPSLKTQIPNLKFNFLPQPFTSSFEVEEGFRRRKDIFKRRFSYYHWGKLSPHVETFPLPQSKVMRWRISIFNKV
jgi:hypothetical protein